MKRFSLILSTKIRQDTKIPVFELDDDGNNLIDEFIEEFTQYENDIAAAFRYIEMTADLIRLPKAKFRELQVEKLPCKVYEAKKNAIRIYLFHEEKTGRVVVLGGMKTTQRKDIKRITKIVKLYYDEKGE